MNKLKKKNKAFKYINKKVLNLIKAFNIFYSSIGNFTKNSFLKNKRHPKTPCNFQVGGARTSVSKPIEYTEEYFYFTFSFY